MNRCIGFNKNGKRCKTRINGDKLICCDTHKPLNDDILESCVMCCKINLKTNEISTLNCGHCFHNKCLNDFLDISPDKYSCIYCRQNGIKQKNKKIKVKKKISHSEKITITNNELHNLLYF